MQQVENGEHTVTVTCAAVIFAICLYFSTRSLLHGTSFKPYSRSVDAVLPVKMSLAIDVRMCCPSLPSSSPTPLAVSTLIHDVRIEKGMTHYPEWKRKGKGEFFRGTHYLLVSKKENAMKKVRALMDQVRTHYPALHHITPHYIVLHRTNTTLSRITPAPLRWEILST